MAVRAWLSLYDAKGGFERTVVVGQRDAEALALSRGAVGVEWKAPDGTRYAVTGQPAPGRYLGRRIA